MTWPSAHAAARSSSAHRLTSLLCPLLRTPNQIPAACPSEEGAQRSPTSCDGSVVAEAELAAHPTDEQLTGAEGGGATEEQGQAPGEEQQGSLGCGAGGEETAAAGGPSLVRQAGSRGSWADAEDEEAEEAQQPAVPVQAPLLPPPPPPPCQPEQHAAPPAQALLQALRAASAASAGAPMPSSGSPSQQRPPPSFVAGLPFAPGAAPAPLRAPLQPGTAPAANAGELVWDGSSAGIGARALSSPGCACNDRFVKGGAERQLRLPRGPQHAYLLPPPLPPSLQGQQWTFRSSHTLCAPSPAAHSRNQVGLCAWGAALRDRGQGAAAPASLGERLRSPGAATPAGLPCKPSHCSSADRSPPSSLPMPAP